MSPPASSTPPDRVAGHIKVLGTLGEGGMGEVFVGFDERLRRRVALKTIHAQFRLDPDFKARFLGEARTLSQLDHPNICRIHDYVEGEDRDFLVLEMVEGETLSRVLETGVDEGRKLAIAEQVTEALAAAHAKGVVHRDLKPGNLMLTADGGVKVLDFGLARPAQRASPEGVPTPNPAALPGPADATLPGAGTPTPADATLRFAPGETPGGEETATRLGTVVGTPAYMSPEQARGQPATTASDMYGLGLLLQELFTGAPPHPPDLDSNALVERARRGETRPIEGVERDLAALVSDLLQPAPAERPTAAETLRRLRWIQGKPRRRMIRLVAAAAVLLLLLGGLKYTLDLKAARDEADRRRGQAEDLIGFMLGDLRGKLSGVGRLDLLEDVGDKALDYYESLPLEDRTPDELARRSEALRQIGEVRIGQGDLDAAADAFAQALRISEDLVEQEPDRTDWLLGLAHAHFWIGNVEWLRGDLGAALTRFEEYRRIAERLAAAEPNETEWRLERAYAHTNLAAVHDARGNDDLALAELSRSIELKEELVAQDPSNTEWRASLANGLSWRGSHLADRGELAAALESFESEWRIRRALIDADPRNVAARYLLTNNLSNGGQLHLLLGDVDAARSRFSEALRLCKSLVAHDPTNQDWQRNLGVAHRDLGELNLAEGEAARARVDLDEAIHILGDLVERDHSNTDWRDELIRARLLAGNAALDSGRPEPALAEAARADALLEPRVSAQPDLWTLRHLQAQADLLRGSALERLARATAADEAWGEAYETLAPAAAASRDANLLDTWARILFRTGHRSKANEVVDTLLAVGYRRPDFLACCAGVQYFEPDADSEGNPSAGEPASHSNPFLSKENP